MSARSRSAALLAVICLTLSPGLALAAKPNQLLDGTASPGSGTTQTTFAFSVAFSSETGFEATSVVALVADGPVPLGLVSGSATAGTYQGTASLPIGTWPVTFEAQVAQGPAPTLAGPTIVVTAPPPPPPASPPPAPALPATPAPTPRPQPIAPTPMTRAATPPPAAPTTTATPAPQPLATQPSAIGSAADPSQAGSPIPSGSPRLEPAEPSAPPTVGVTAATTPSQASGSHGPELPLAWLLLIGVLMGAVSAWAWGRRRHDRGEERAMMAPPPDTGSEPILLAARAHQRRAAVAMHSEDPILAAMGVGARPDPPALEPLSSPLPADERPIPASRDRRVG